MPLLNIPRLLIEEDKMQRIFVVMVLLLISLSLYADNLALISVRNNEIHLDIYREGILEESQPLGIVKSFGSGGGSIYTVGIESKSTMRTQLNTWDMTTGDFLAHHLLEGTSPGWVQGPIEQILYDDRKGLVSFVTFNLIDTKIHAMLNVLEVATNQSSIYEIPIGKRFPMIASDEEGIIIYQQNFENLLLFDLNSREFRIYDLRPGQKVSFDHLGTFEMTARGKLVNLTADIGSVSDMFKMAPEEVGVRIGSFRAGTRAYGAMFQKENEKTKTLSLQTEQANGSAIPGPPPNRWERLPT